MGPIAKIGFSDQEPNLLWSNVERNYKEYLGIGSGEMNKEEESFIKIVRKLAGFTLIKPESHQDQSIKLNFKKVDDGWEELGHDNTLSDLKDETFDRLSLGFKVAVEKALMDEKKPFYEMREFDLFNICLF